MTKFWMNNLSDAWCTLCTGVPCNLSQKGRSFVVPLSCQIRFFSIERKERQGAAGNKSQQPVLSFLWSLVHHLTFCMVQIWCSIAKSVVKYIFIRRKYSNFSLLPVCFQSASALIQVCFWSSSILLLVCFQYASVVSNLLLFNFQ